LCFNYISGSPIDLAAAAQYFKVGADRNHPDAQREYGLCLQFGLGVPIDLVRASKYLTLAADQNDADAQFHYGICLRDAAFSNSPMKLVGRLTVIGKVPVSWLASKQPQTVIITNAGDEFIGRTISAKYT
jgi:TPR repeat protein